MRLIKGLVALATLCVFATPISVADIMLDLDPGVGFYKAGGPGGGRAMYLTADEEITLTGFGIYGNITAESYDVVVYAGNGWNQDPGAVLATASASSGGSGWQWYDIAITYDLQVGQEYIINWRPTDGGFNDWGELEYTNEWGNSPDDDVDLGVVTIQDGRQGYNADSWSNYLAGHHRMSYIPEPSAFALLAIGALAVRRR